MPNAAQRDVGPAAMPIGCFRAKTNGTRQRTTRAAAQTPVTGRMRHRAIPLRCGNSARRTGPNPGTNSANFWDNTYGSSVGGVPSYMYNPATDYLTDIGAYPSWLRHYGTLDQTGDAGQWNEAIIGSSCGVRGGNFSESISPYMGNGWPTTTWPQRRGPTGPAFAWLTWEPSLSPRPL